MEKSSFSAYDMQLAHDCCERPFPSQGKPMAYNLPILSLLLSSQTRLKCKAVPRNTLRSYALLSLLLSVKEGPSCSTWKPTSDRVMETIGLSQHLSNTMRVLCLASGWMQKFAAKCLLWGMGFLMRKVETYRTSLRVLSGNQVVTSTCTVLCETT